MGWKEGSRSTLGDSYFGYVVIRPRVVLGYNWPVATGVATHHYLGSGHLASCYLGSILDGVSKIVLGYKRMAVTWVAAWVAT